MASSAPDNHETAILGLNATEYSPGQWRDLMEPGGDVHDDDDDDDRKESSRGSPKHFKNPSICSSAATGTETFKAEDQMLDVVLQKSSPADTSQWVLNAPEPPGLWHEITVSVRQTISSCGNKYSSLMDQPFSVLQQIFPILVWGRNYKATKFKHDLMAGLTIASLCIPQVKLITSSSFLYVN